MRLYATMKALFYAPFYVALSLGHFRDEGIDIEFRTAPHPDDAVPALLEGRVDVTWGGPIDLLVHYDTAPDPDLVGFCEVVSRDPFLLVGRTPNAQFRFQDLVGLRVAPVSEVETPWLCLQEDIRRSGIDPAQFTPKPGRTMRTNLAALESGELDVIQVYEPLAEELISGQNGYLWYASATRGLNTYTTLFTHRRTLEG
jgi:NitT/TauT family transport system substrate-binding protein